MGCKHNHSIWWCRECGAVAEYWEVRRGRPPAEGWIHPHSETGPLAEREMEPEVCPEPDTRWWPQQVRCQRCGEMIWLGDQEPGGYLADCSCGGLGIVRPK